MGWRDVIQVESKINPLVQKVQSIQKPASVHSVPYVPKGEKLKNCEIPRPEAEQEHFLAEVGAVIQELNDAGVRMMDTPQVNRRLAMALETKMTQAANRGDIEAARKSLRKWRACFMPEKETRP